MISSWLKDTITVQRYLGRTEYGDPLYGPPFTMKARVEESVQIIRGIDGTERNSTHEIATKELVESKDRIWIPGKDTSDANDALRPLSFRTAATKSGNRRFYLVLV